MSEEERRYSREELQRGAYVSTMEARIQQLEGFLTQWPNDMELQRRLEDVRKEYADFMKTNKKPYPKMTMSISIASAEVTVTPNATKPSRRNRRSNRKL